MFTLTIGSGRTVGERMLDDRRLPLISFTGSTQVGEHVAATVAKRFGRTILELGGNNAIIVTEDANLELADAGDSLRRRRHGRPALHVHAADHRAPADRRRADRRAWCAPTSRCASAIRWIPATLMGPLVTPEAVTDMFAALDQIKAEGGEIVTGGGRRTDLGPQFVEPTIVRMPAQSAIVKTETFAPILYVLEYDTFDDALALHNDVPQGLSSAIFTESVRKAEEFLSPKGSDCGIANVNIGTSGAEIGGAFGGEKETGGGRESGSDAWKAYMRRQTNTVNWSTALPLAQGIRFGE